MAEIDDATMESMDMFSSNEEAIKYLLLTLMQQMNEPVGSWILKTQLEKKEIAVSTATVGRFLKSLDAQGFTELVGTQGRIITGKGIQHVNNLTKKMQREKLRKKMITAAQPQNLHELLDLYRTRRLLECETARMAAIRATSEDIRQLEVAVLGHESCLESCADPTEPALDFHGKVAEASNARFLSASLNILINEESKLESKILEMAKNRNAEYALHHKLIAEAIKNGDPDEAEKQMRIHMDAMIAEIEEQIRLADAFGSEDN